MINTREYTQRLEELQHGLITTEEWMAYCATIRNSISVKPHPRSHEEPSYNHHEGNHITSHDTHHTS